ncbi:MAG: hypothetical protein DMF91_10465 [Acidobacteria bacterium]|nr:MAG: hypothetical protein DMF91_10465 [Acidobacteriota bacterium]
MESLKIVCVSAYSTPLQNTATTIRSTTSPLCQTYRPAHAKYTMMLRLVSWKASHTLVLPVSR